MVTLMITKTISKRPRFCLSRAGSLQVFSPASVLDFRVDLCSDEAR